MAQQVKSRRLSVLWHTLTDPSIRWLYYVIAVFLVSRFLVTAVGYIAQVAIPDTNLSWAVHLAPHNVFADMWTRWDSLYYYDIVTKGYAADPTSIKLTAFFPVYPILTRIAMVFVGDPVVAGLRVSNAALLCSLIVLYQLTVLEFKENATAQRAVFYTAVFPTAFFFSAFYAESTFLLMTVTTMYLARRQQWLLAGLVGMIASATRITGILLVASVGLEWLAAQGWTLSQIRTSEAWRNLQVGLARHWKSALPILLMPLGLGAYMLYLYVTFGNALAFLVAQQSWGERENPIPFAGIETSIRQLAALDYRASVNPIWTTLLNLVVLILALLVSIAVWRRLGASYGVYMVAALLIPASSSLLSMSRFVLVLFPAMMMLGHWGRWTIVDRVVTISFCILLGVLTALFASWIFVA